MIRTAPYPEADQAGSWTFVWVDTTKPTGLHSCCIDLPYGTTLGEALAQAMTAGLRSIALLKYIDAPHGLFARTGNSFDPTRAKFTLWKDLDDEPE